MTNTDRKLQVLTARIEEAEARIAEAEHEFADEIHRLNDELDRLCRAVGIPLPTADDDDPALPVGAGAPGAHRGGNGN
jgi:outer membrane protein TolC